MILNVKQIFKYLSVLSILSPNEFRDLVCCLNCTYQIFFNLIIKANNMFVVVIVVCFLIKQNTKHPITALHIHIRHVRDKMNERGNVRNLLKYEELLINLLKK